MRSIERRKRKRKSNSKSKRKSKRRTEARKNILVQQGQLLVIVRDVTFQDLLCDLGCGKLNKDGSLELLVLWNFSESHGEHFTMLREELRNSIQSDVFREGFLEEDEEREEEEKKKVGKGEIDEKRKRRKSTTS
jgi:hypothetical protein